MKENKIRWNRIPSWGKIEQERTEFDDMGQRRDKNRTQMFTSKIEQIKRTECDDKGKRWDKKIEHRCCLVK